MMFQTLEINPPDFLRPLENQRQLPQNLRSAGKAENKNRAFFSFSAYKHRRFDKMLLKGP
jgi:hypothetical protein